MWTYKSGTGELRRRGALRTTGYSGHGAGKNNPLMQNIPRMGPIPAGVYWIGEPFDHPLHGLFCMRLTPVTGTPLFGRSGFLLHGDSRVHPGEASEGCIVADRPSREEVHASGDVLLVVEDWL